MIPKEFAQEAAENHAEIAQSRIEAVRLSRRLGSKQLAVPVNPEFDNGLMFVTDPADPIAVGKLNFTVIGPYKEDLKNLRDDWNEWLRTQEAQDQLAVVRRRNRDDENLLHSSEIGPVLGPLLAQAAVLGDRDKVTLPNLASLMFFLQESGGGTMLLTGDGHWEDILAGLENCGQLTPGGGFHVNVLKVQHHASEHNWHLDFGKRITADHYIFCGNGAHKNPDLSVLDAILDSRIGSQSRRSHNAEVGQPFKFWFNCASSVAKSANKAHMKKIEQKMKVAETTNPGVFRRRVFDQEFVPTVNLMHIEGRKPEYHTTIPPAGER